MLYTEVHRSLIKKIHYLLCVFFVCFCPFIQIIQAINSFQIIRVMSCLCQSSRCFLLWLRCVDIFLSALFFVTLTRPDSDARLTVDYFAHLHTRPPDTANMPRQTMHRCRRTELKTNDLSRSPNDSFQ